LIPETIHINGKDRSFLRALLNHDYVEQQQQLALGELQWMHAHPNEIPYIFLEYDEGPLKPSFKSHEEAPLEFAKELTSPSRRRLHVMSTHDGDDPILWVLPLIAESMTLSRDLRLFADSFPPGTEWEEIEPVGREKVRELLLQAGPS
jgi:hypothetical protein